VHLNHFASLSPVAENGAYTNLAWGDTRETYAPAKRGNLVVATFESIVNDDTHAVTRIPRKLAAAAVATLNEFVAGLFTANGGAGAVLADGVPVLDAASHQGNAGTGPTFALSAGAVQSALIALLKMTNTAGKRLGITGRYLLVPTDLYYTARTILASERVPGTNNDVNPTIWYLSARQARTRTMPLSPLMQGGTRSAPAARTSAPGSSVVLSGTP
jgi:hypothetical protein